MDKIRSIRIGWILIVFGIMLVFSCTNKPDVAAEVKSIDSLTTEVDKALEICEKMDTSWVLPLTQKANNNIKTIKKIYLPDSIDANEARMVTYYKGYRKVGRKFTNDRLTFITEMKKCKAQLANLKTDAENGALSKEDVKKYLNEEKLVTTDLLYKFKDFKSSSEAVLKNFDSINPLIEKIIEVYSLKNEESKNNKSGTTIH